MHLNHSDYLYSQLISFRDASKACRRNRGNDSTSALRNHARVCDPRATASSHMMESFASGCSYRREDFHIAILMWIIKRCRPFSIIDDSELREMLTMLYKSVSIPSQRTISRHVETFYSLCHTKVVATLKEYKGAIHIGLDTWTAGNGVPFMGVTLHCCVDDKIQSMILDFIHLTANHTGEYLAKEVHACLQRFSIQDRLLSVASDNASNNGTLVDCLARLLPAWGGQRNRIRCLGHILSLAMQVC